MNQPAPHPAPIRFGNLAAAAMASNGLFLVLVMTGLALRLYLCVEANYWHDEYWSAGFSNPANSLGQVISLTISDVHPPLYQILLYYWYHLFGFTELSGRLLSFLFGAAAIPALYSLAERIYHRDIARIAVLLIALNPFAIFYSAENRSNELLLLLTISSTYYFATALKNQNGYGYLGYFLTSLALAYTHYFGIMVLLTHFIYLAIYWGRQKNHRTCWTICAIYLLLLLAYLPMFDAVMANLQREVFTIKHHGFLLLLAYIPLFFGGLFSIPFMLLAALLLLINRKALGFMEYQIILAITIMLLLPYCAGFFMNPIMRPKNAIIAIPLLILLLAYVIQRSDIRYVFSSILLSLAIAMASTVYTAATKGNDLDPLLQEATAHHQPIYLLTHEWRTAEFVFTKAAMNRDKYATLELHHVRELQAPPPATFWLACYVSCSSAEVFRDVIPDGYHITKKISENGIEAILLLRNTPYADIDAGPAPVSTEKSAGQD